MHVFLGWQTAGAGKSKIGRPRCNYSEFCGGPENRKPFHTVECSLRAVSCAEAVTVTVQVLKIQILKVKVFFNQKLF